MSKKKEKTLQIKTKSKINKCVCVCDRRYGEINNTINFFKHLQFMTSETYLIHIKSYREIERDEDLYGRGGRERPLCS